MVIKGRRKADTDAFCSMGSKINWPTICTANIIFIVKRPNLWLTTYYRVFCFQLSEFDYFFLIASFLLSNRDSYFNRRLHAKQKLN